MAEVIRNIFHWHITGSVQCQCIQWPCHLPLSHIACCQVFYLIIMESDVVHGICPTAVEHSVPPDCDQEANSQQNTWK